ncbi:MAG: hypothetical protein ACM3U1_08230 [Chloroflexota bacterium]
MMKAYKIILFSMLAVFNCLPLTAQTGKWTQLHPTNSPSARKGHGMAPIGDDIALYFFQQIDLNIDFNDKIISYRSKINLRAE